MSSNQELLSEAYRELSRLYKNPTRLLDGLATSNQDAELADDHKKLFDLFQREKWIGAEEKPALYYKVLSLLYEVDDYRGRSPSVEEIILKEYPVLTERFEVGQNLYGRQKADFRNSEARSLWKAKVLCCVAAIESRRKISPLNVLADELKDLEAFVEKNLHKPKENLPAWTTLAFVQSAQARVARKSQDYSYVQDKLRRVVQCLDERAAEIVEQWSALKRRAHKTSEEKEEIECLVDDLALIRQKQTLSSLFNVGLAALQRGFLRDADNACQAARLPFRLHGQYFHRLFNDLVILSIKRARISRENNIEFQDLKVYLKQDILPFLQPKGPCRQSQALSVCVARIGSSPLLLRRE